MSTALAPLFDWRFLVRVSDWSLGLGAAVAVGGALLLSSPAFAFGCAVTIVVDVVLVRLAASRGGHAAGEGLFDSRSALIFVGGRLVFKIAALTIAALAGIHGLLAGTAVGAVFYDLMLCTVGSVLAVRGMYRAQGGGA